MNIVFQIALGVVIGVVSLVLLFWFVAVVTQYLSGDRYFTPSRHVVASRLKKRKNQVEEALSNQETSKHTEEISV